MSVAPSADRGVDMSRVADLLREVAETVVLPRHKHLEAGDIGEKLHGELVTIADRESEAWLSTRLTELLPGSTIVGEEAVFSDAGLLSRLGGDAPVWIIDPIDGTHNFAHGHDRFAIIIALVDRGETVAGWIYAPVGGAIAMAERGSGTRLNGSAVRFAEGRRSGFRGFAARQLYERASEADALVAQVDRPSCVGQEYLEILAGKRDFGAYTKVKPWDHAAGSFMIAEAGGHSALLDKQPYDVTNPAGYLLNASSAYIWQQLWAIMADHEGEHSDG